MLVETTSTELDCLDVLRVKLKEHLANLLGGLIDLSPGILKLMGLQKKQ